MISAVLEIGPATVCRSDDPTGLRVRRELISAALDGLDDTVVLVDEQPVSVPALWRQIVIELIGTRCEEVTLVHPSWWPRHRLTCLLDAAATVATEVRALSRAAVIAGDDAVTVVEIADDVIAISAPARPPEVRIRPQDPGEIAAAIETTGATRVLIDAPAEVAGALDCSGAVQAALRRRSIPVHQAAIREVPPPVRDPATSMVAHRSWRIPVITAASVVLTLCALGLDAVRYRAPVPDAVDLAEGRITVRIPDQWSVVRITAGPGSRRVQANSPADPTVALHVTQSYSPGETLDRTADLVGQAMAEQPAGVFADFNPADRRAGRPAVTYREIRVGRDIRWAVVLDGSTRISIGCQSAPGRDDIVAGPCEQAIASAHESVGTDRGAPTSNPLSAFVTRP
ncbi:type VII secretion-associated protein [Mycobacterium sp. shizuoka-1]|uniref:type VII secretion-associated protein n=1 Tax=Mycobacterium sp. shizuoka-1 TaxID=2039281 RepID=UPI000C05CFA3|nr:type VII secretion-associated protein [Mycobacterium sp. shizuoka-1]GAY14948.1 type VII secretion-associated protein [Mycobacterium sp. shizuoka-1]